MCAYYCSINSISNDPCTFTVPRDGKSLLPVPRKINCEITASVKTYFTCFVAIKYIITANSKLK